MFTDVASVSQMERERKANWSTSYASRQVILNSRTSFVISLASDKCIVVYQCDADTMG